jgi:hypothetical protein
MVLDVPHMQIARPAAHELRDHGAQGLPQKVVQHIQPAPAVVRNVYASSRGRTSWTVRILMYWVMQH